MSYNEIYQILLKHLTSQSDMGNIKNGGIVGTDECIEELLKLIKSK